MSMGSSTSPPAITAPLSLLMQEVATRFGCIAWTKAKDIDKRQEEIPDGVWLLDGRPR